jgi:hypothetical protein
MNYAPNNLRPVQINFELYVDSQDAAFKLELVELMITNIKDLRDGAKSAWIKGDADGYYSTLHKTKSTVTLLNDSEFNHAIEEVRTHINSNSIGSQEHVLSHMNELATSIITSLEHEAALLKAQI